MKTFNLKYIVGTRPTPMIAIYNDKNEQIFLDIFNNFNSDFKIQFNQKFNNENNHVWDPFAYIIYNDNLEIISFTYLDISHLFYLLRYINKELKFSIQATNIGDIENEFKDWKNEVNISEG